MSRPALSGTGTPAAPPWAVQVVDQHPGCTSAVPVGDVVHEAVLAFRLSTQVADTQRRRPARDARLTPGCLCPPPGVRLAPLCPGETQGLPHPIVGRKEEWGLKIRALL